MNIFTGDFCCKKIKKFWKEFFNLQIFLEIQQNWFFSPKKAFPFRDKKWPYSLKGAISRKKAKFSYHWNHEKSYKNELKKSWEKEIVESLLKPYNKSFQKNQKINFWWSYSKKPLKKSCRKQLWGMWKSLVEGSMRREFCITEVFLSLFTFLIRP